MFTTFCICLSFSFVSARCQNEKKNLKKKLTPVFDVVDVSYYFYV